MRILTFVLVVLTTTLVVSTSIAIQESARDAGSWESAKRQFNAGNFKEAFTTYQRLLKSQSASPDQIVTGFDYAQACLQKLNKIADLDAFREKIVATHSEKWQVLASVAKSYMQYPHYGYMIGGEYKRGDHRGGGKVFNSYDRDRVRALQLHFQAYQLIKGSSNAPGATEANWISRQFAYALLVGDYYRGAWRMQELTDLTALPDYEEGHKYGEGNRGAPVDSDGDPVFYNLPSTWEEAKNDGERWRWVLNQAVEWSPDSKNAIRLIRARFLQTQFGVETLQRFGMWYGRGPAVEESAGKSGTYALHTLKENETIARLATGIKRFELPDEHNHVKIYQQILVDSLKTHAYDAAVALAHTFQNRRQFEKAKHYWEICQRFYPENDSIKESIRQIVGNWGRFEPVMSQPAGKGATVDFRFRNGKRVEFLARRIDFRRVFDDLKTYLKSNPNQLDWNELNIGNLGYRLIRKGQEKYLGEEVARWSLDLEPLENHFDRRVTITTPLQDAGAYLLTAKMEDGNETHIVLWLSDTAILKKPMENKSLYYIADAVSGKPIADCNIEFFGYWHQHIDGKRYHVHTKSFAEKTDAEGQVILDGSDKRFQYQWVGVATNDEGRLAFLGFEGIWMSRYADDPYQQVKAFAITDRPVYRPNQEVQFKFWVRHAKHDLADESMFAGKSFNVEIINPKNEKVLKQQLTADGYGGIEGNWTIPEGATLGQYQIKIARHGTGTFRVEEYKKPEFEVSIDAPQDIVVLGEKFKAKIAAKYYYGEPVTSAKVKYKVLRTNYSSGWYPSMPWDWLYGPGYWWFAPNYEWYPGWARWGCLAPHPWWFWRAPSRPEIVMEREVEIGPDGTVEVEIDTALAKEFHPNQDHSYQIQAEVVDASRRTIVGNGQVLVSRKPFKVYLWTNKGYYRVGDTVRIDCAARSLNGQPIEGEGVLRLLKVQYEESGPVETEIGRWEFPSGESGLSHLQIKASEPGQYRISYELTDENDNTIEGGQLITITGEGFDGSEFRFNDLELIPEEREYAPGEKIALQINTNRVGASVLLFTRPSNGVYLKPQLIHLQGKSKVVGIEVQAKDAPNFFIEAVTVHSGRVHRAVREIFVPPSKRVLNVEVVPSSQAYLPGQAAKILLKLTDSNGEPFVGSMVLSVYDKALEYISGGSNVSDIREFFWKWRRSHRPQGRNNLERASGVHVKENEANMRDLGVYGATIADELGRNQGDSSGSIESKDMGRARSSLGFSANGRDSGREVSFSAATENLSLPESGLQTIDGLAEGADGSFTQSLEVDLVQPTIRQRFADTALWIGSIETNADGIAEAKLEMPENLTAWNVRAWAMGHGTRVGEGTAEVVTRKNLLLRMQAPRFFIEKDEVVLSANVHNYLTKTKTTTVKLELEGDHIEGPEQLVKIIEIPAGEEKRVDWRVKVVREGTATIRMSALTDEESDSMQMSFPVHVHGMLKTESFTGVIRPDKELAEFVVQVPSDRRPEQTKLEIRYTPTLAGAMVDALPYLLDYPYGCTEQTLNRFLPAVLTQQTLKKMGLDLAEIEKKRTNLNSQEIGDDQERAKDWKRFKRNPVFNDAELAKIVKAGVNRITEMQLSDGGWGWFSGWGERSSAHTTAVVMHGLLTAQSNDVAIVPGVIDRGANWLQEYQVEQVRRLDNYGKKDAKGNQVLPYKVYADNLDALVYMVLAESGRDNGKMRSYLYRDRTQLAVYGLATFGIALHKHGDVEKLDMVMRNLAQYVEQDDENQTAWLEMPSSGWWYWYGSEYEAHAYYLKLLAAKQPDSEIASRMVKYLLNNRKHATYWKSTRDTALVIEAFADYLKASGEDTPEATVEVWIDGEKRKEVSINRENLFSFDNKLVLAGDQLSAGRHTVQLRKQGDSPIYFNGYLTNFTLEDDIEAAGLELKVERNFFKLTPQKASKNVSGSQGQVVKQQVEKYARERLVNLAEIKSGDLVEVELIVESKNDYEYILLEDMKAAGFEPVEVRSGYNGNELGAYMELRDDRVSLFVSRLARGKHSVSYRLRAEIPGRFSALPTRASAMYAPELKANSDEIKLRITD